MPEQLRRYVQDPSWLVELSERDWLDQLDSQIERSGFDEKGARLSQPLETEIMSVLVDSPRESNVALLLADFGEGKSFFTVSLCMRLRERFLESPNSGSPVPVRLHLRGYRHVSAPADFLRAQLELVGLSTTDWATLRRLPVLVVPGRPRRDVRSPGSCHSARQSRADRVAPRNARRASSPRSRAGPISSHLASTASCFTTGCAGRMFSG